jgi:hypothetical protein
MSAAPGIILIAGTLTFGNEWYQTNDINWRVPIATFGAAWLISGVAEVSDKTAVSLAVMALIVACTTPFNGKSVVQEIASTVGPGSGGKTGAQPVTKTTAAATVIDTMDA